MSIQGINQTHPAALANGVFANSTSKTELPNGATVTTVRNQHSAIVSVTTTPPQPGNAVGGGINLTA